MKVLIIVNGLHSEHLSNSTVLCPQFSWLTKPMTNPGWDFVSSSCWLDLYTFRCQWDFYAFWWACVASPRASCKVPWDLETNPVTKFGVPKGAATKRPRFLDPVRFHFVNPRYDCIYDGPVLPILAGEWSQFCCAEGHRRPVIVAPVLLAVGNPGTSPVACS